MSKGRGSLQFLLGEATLLGSRGKGQSSHVYTVQCIWLNAVIDIVFLSLWGENAALSAPLR